MSDPINPEHYTSHPSGIESIVIAERLGFNLGNAWKYIVRCDLKGNRDEDLRKALWYIEREAERLAWDKPVSYNGLSGSQFIVAEPEDWRREALMWVLEACRSSASTSIGYLQRAVTVLNAQIRETP